MSSDPKHTKFHRIPHLAVVATASMLILAGCQSGGNPLDFGLGKKDAEPEPEKIDVAVLRAYCPKVTLRSGTAFFNKYEKGGEEDPDRLVYQGSITEVTRDCAFNDGTITLTVGVAGRVTPGPKGAPGPVTMPIRVAVVSGDEVLFSELYKYQANAGSAATPFVFTETNIVIAQDRARSTQIFVGYDEGPYNTP